MSEPASVRCPTCLEAISSEAEICPECDEPTMPSSAAPSSVAGYAPSAAAEAGHPSFFAMHWRPLVTLGAMAGLLCAGIALRYLAPGRFMPPRAQSRPASITAAPCATACWSGEACQLGECAWQAPNDVGHLARDAYVTGPFSLPKEVTDVLPLDRDRFAIAFLNGIEVRSSRTGEVLTFISDAPQSMRLYRVGDVVYATSPQRIYVVDAASTKLVKTIETGALVGSVTVGASGRRALASLPNAHAIAILATEYHAEIDRIQFGDDAVGPVGTDDTGKRALTTTGQVPLPGLRDPQGGAAYAFDPSRLASAQDRVRASLLGNPVSVLMVPNGDASYVALRAENALVRLDWLPSGAIRLSDRIATCREPEQVELLRRGRRALVRCNEGRALEVVDLSTQKILRRISFNARATDMAISPDGEQAVVALPGESSGAVAIVELSTYETTLVPLGVDPTRVRLAPDGKTALVFSDRSKVAWVLR